MLRIGLMLNFRASHENICNRAFHFRILSTSTIQTRARYFLFIPWIYRELVHRKTSAQRIAQEARKQEIEFIHALAASADTTGG